MSSNTSEKAHTFRRLHEGPGAFVIANPWDLGSTRLLSELGFVALATSSGASAAALGRRDGELSREEVLAHARAVAGASDLPVSADLENGFGDTPHEVAETIRLAGETGIVGGSIEDSSRSGDRSCYELALAIERVAAAVEAARSLPFAFVLTARAENFLRGRPDLDDTIARLVAYERAGADVLFAPGLPDLESVRAVCQAVTRPVNFMVGLRGKSFSVAELEEVGVRRISLAGSLYRIAMSAAAAAAREIREHGTFGYVG